MMDDTVEIQGHIIKEAGAAILFHYPGAPGLQKNFFLPRSEIGIVQEVSGITVVVPRWLAERKGFF